MENWIKRLLGTRPGCSPSPLATETKNTEEKIKHWMREGYAHQQAGNLIEAKKLYKKIMAHKPDDFDALFMLGILYRAEQNPQEAIESIQSAIRSNPAISAFHYELGALHIEQKDYRAAESPLRTAIALDPEYAEAHNDLGTVLVQLQDDADPEEAIACFRQAIAINGALAPTHYNLALELIKVGDLNDAKAHLQQADVLHPNRLETLLQLGKTCQKLKQAEEAENFFTAAIKLQPDSIEAQAGLGSLLFDEKRYLEAIALYKDLLRDHPSLADVQYALGCCYLGLERLAEAKKHFLAALDLNQNLVDAYINLGNIHSSQENHSEALRLYNQAIELKPDFAIAYLNQARALSDLGKYEDALQAQKKCIELDPSDPVAYSNLGFFYHQLDDLDEALKQAKKSIEIKPDNVDGLLNLALIYLSRGTPQEALAIYDKAIALKPDNADAHWGKSLLSLLLGNYPIGWKEYEWRWKLKSFEIYKHPYTEPLWRGKSHPGKTLLIYPEQGLGDSIHFVRYAALAAPYFEKIILLCNNNLKQLFQTISGVDVVISEGEVLPHFDYRIPLLSLPGLLGTTLETIPANIPYIFPDYGLSKKWKDIIDSLSKPGDLKVGLVWAGGAIFKKDRLRSCKLSMFAPLARVPNATFFSLQKGAPADQALAPPEGLELLDLTSQLNNFADTAAFISNLDLVISVDTAVAHLAGALGKPTWILLPFAPDFRWLLERNDSPWYPSMRLFRQKQWGNWPEVFEHMALELVNWPET
ncbi:MAG: tetratricopeptide repeat protein [Burkholderiales bacterium]